MQIDVNSATGSDPSTTPSDRPHIVVTGLMGVGKTTAGGRLARLLDRPHRDSDEDLHTLFGRSGRELAETVGIDELHRLEASVLLGALAADRPSVISAAGWVVEDPRCREAMAGRALVVVLEAPVDEVARRIATGDHRRSMDTAELTRLAASRAELYRRVADHTVDATADPESVAAAILDALATPSGG